MGEHPVKHSPYQVRRSHKGPGLNPNSPPAGIRHHKQWSSSTDASLPLCYFLPSQVFSVLSDWKKIERENGNRWPPGTVDSVLAPCPSNHVGSKTKKPKRHYFIEVAHHWSCVPYFVHCLGLDRCAKGTRDAVEWCYGGSVSAFLYLKGDHSIKKSKQKVRHQKT